MGCIGGIPIDGHPKGGGPQKGIGDICCWTAAACWRCQDDADRCGWGCRAFVVGVREGGHGSFALLGVSYSSGSLCCWLAMMKPFAKSNAASMFFARPEAVSIRRGHPSRRRIAQLTLYRDQIWSRCVAEITPLPLPGISKGPARTVVIRLQGHKPSPIANGAEASTGNAELKRLRIVMPYQHKQNQMGIQAVENA